MSILMWIIFGALAGWIASMIANTNQQMGAFANIGVGIVGAIIGGWIASMFGISEMGEFSLGGLLIAIAGAVLFLSIIKAVSSSRHTA